MSKVIEFWDFVEYRQNKTDHGNTTEIPNNVSQIPTNLNLTDSIEKEVDEFHNQINIIIEAIIQNWIIDYLDVSNQPNNHDNLSKYNKDTDLIFTEMKKKANTIDDTIDYMENTLDDFFAWEFVLRTIADLLSIYRDEVCDVLLDKYTNNKVAYKEKDNVLIELEPKEADVSDELQFQFDNLAENIINSWISDYLSSINQLDTPLIRKKYNEVTNKLYEKILIEANIIDDTIVYLEDEVNMTFYNDFIMTAASNMLSRYRKEVFDMLVEKFGE